MDCQKQLNKKYKNIKFLVVGDGPDLDYFKKFSVKYNTVEWENGADFAPEYLLSLPNVQW